jgi:hypothetical protein
LKEEKRVNRLLIKMNWTPGPGEPIKGMSYDRLMRQAQGFLGSIFKGTPGGASSQRTESLTLPSRKSEGEKLKMEMIGLPRDVEVEELDEEESDELTISVRDKVERRIIEILKGRTFSKEQEETICHWILSNGKKDFLQSVLHFAGFADEDRFVNSEPFNGVHNAAVVRERYRRNQPLIRGNECNYTENRVALRRLCQVGQEGIMYGSIGINENIFTSGLFSEEIKINVAQVLTDNNVTVKKGAPEKSFVMGHAKDLRERTGGKSRSRYRESPSNDDQSSDASAEAFGNYDEVIEQVRVLMEQAENAGSNQEKMMMVDKVRVIRKALLIAFVATQKFVEKSVRSEHEMVEEYRNVSIILNRAILKLQGIEDNSKLDLMVDMEVMRNGFVGFLQKKLPPNFAFYPPLGRDNPFSEASRKNQSLTKFPFDGSTSFNSWACQIRDGIWRISDRLVPAAKKYEHIKNECLSGEARLEFTGGVGFVTNYEMELINGMERLQIKYGLTISSYSKLLTELNEIKFDLQNVESMKRNIVKMQSLEEQMVNACPNRDPDELAGIVYDHLKSNMPPSVWSEADSYIQMNCRSLINQCQYSGLLNFASLKCREILSRDSFQNNKKPNEDLNKSGKKGKNLHVQFMDRKKNNEKGEKMRMIVESESREESEDESAIRKYGNDQESSEDEEEINFDVEEDEGELRKFGNNGGNNGGKQGGRGFSRQKGDNAPSIPLGVGMINGEKKKVVDFEKIKSSPCFLCDRKEHGMSDCPLSVARKMVIIEDKVICTRCFAIGHLIGECPIGRDLTMYCQLCRRRGHWDVLCWSTMNKKMMEERKRKQDGLTVTAPKARKMTSQLIIDSDVPRKYRDERDES